MRQRRIRHRHSDSEIRYFDGTIFSNQHVLRFDIAMDDPVCMGVIDRITNLSDDIDGLRHR